MREYYIDLGFKDVRIGWYNAFDFDEEGIPRYRYPFGVFYNITFICHFALYHHTLYIKFGRSADLELFMRVSDWIIKHGELTNDCFLFPYRFSFNGLSAPWISALGQGRLLSVLARAYELSGDEQYLVAARKAMKPFEIPVADGGVLARFPDGEVGFEEYPLPTPNIALNGFITSLVGLYDLGEIGREQRGTELFMAGLRSLERNLYRYDLGYWSAYDLTGHVSSENYHQYHIIQLWALFEMTGRQIFKRYSSNWQLCRKGLRFRVFRTLSLSKKFTSAPAVHTSRLTARLKNVNSNNRLHFP